MVQVNNNTPIVLRVKFFKKGALQYVSHLDLVRTMMKIIVRSGLPLRYTEGFNPKPKLTFAAPLSTGTESECEYMDIRLTERMDTDEALKRLNANMTENMQATEAYYPESKFTDLAYLSYEVRINTVGASEELAKVCRDALGSEALPIMKKTKSGIAEVDIKPLIKSAEVRFDNGELCLNLVISSSPSAFLNPELVIKVLREKCGILSSGNLLAEYYSVVRKEAFFADMKPFC